MLTHTRPGPPPAAGAVGMVGAPVRVVEALRELPIGELFAGACIGGLAGIDAGVIGPRGIEVGEVVIDVDNQLCTP